MRWPVALDITAQKFHSYSYEDERRYYSRRWPTDAKPYLHLDAHLRCWLDAERVFRGKRVLDVGAGECTYTRLIADRFEPQRIVACELFAERMQPAFRENSNPRWGAVSGDCFRLPFRNGSFDVVFASLFLSQLPNLSDAIREFRRLLAPEGIFVGFEPNPFHPVILYRYLTKPHSANQYLFWPHKVCPVFKANGFAPRTQFFYAKMPWIRNRLLGPCIGVLARKDP